MTPTFTWSIPSDGVLITSNKNQNNIVAVVRYVLTANDGVNTQSLKGSVKIDFDDTASFTPFQELTEAQVIEWVKSSIRSVDLQHYKYALTNKLMRLANPSSVPVIKPAPWNTCVQA